MGSTGSVPPSTNSSTTFIWCPKYRKSVLEGEVRDRLEALIEEEADELDLEILELAIRPDHVHRFITGDPTLAPNKIMQQVTVDRDDEPANLSVSVGATPSGGTPRL